MNKCTKRNSQCKLKKRIQNWLNKHITQTYFNDYPCSKDVKSTETKGPEVWINPF